MRPRRSRPGLVSLAKALSCTFRSRASASIAAFTLACALALSAGGAMAGPTLDLGGGATLRWYGQLSPAFLSIDDGQAVTSELDDNTASNSRVGLWYIQPMGEGREFSISLETGLGFRSTSGLSQLSAGYRPWMDWETTDIRKIDLRLRSEFGTFYAGQGFMASDGAGQIDFSGTVLSNYVALTDLNSAILLRDGSGALTTISFSNAFASYDGGRYGRIRYDTPSLNGVTVSAALGKDILSDTTDADIWDAAVRYDGDIGQVRIGAAIGYQSLRRPTLKDRNDIFGSASVEHASGANFTFALGNRDIAGTFTYAKLGYKGSWLGLGPTAVTVDYYHGSDMALTGAATRSRSNVYGIGLVQTVSDWSLDTFVGYRTYSFDDNSPRTYQDAQSLIVGARWKF